MKKITELFIDVIYEYINSFKDERIILLKNKEAIMWIFGDTSFLPPFNQINKTQDKIKLKKLEDTWGQKLLKKRRPDLKLDKQWTNKFGEHICEELIILYGKEPRKPIKKLNLQPDIEEDDFIWEVKTSTFFTDGTACEKILGTPLKYAKVPFLYSKPLRILCIGGAEKTCKKRYGIMGLVHDSEKRKFISFYAYNKIEYVTATDMIIDLLSKVH